MLRLDLEPRRRRGAREQRRHGARRRARAVVLGVARLGRFDRRAAVLLGEQHDASLKREASREDLSSDAVARSELLERELVDAKMKLAQTAMELGELRMARSATPPPPAAAPPKSPKRSWLNRKK